MAAKYAAVWSGEMYVVDFVDDDYDVDGVDEAKKMGMAAL